jgi:hypothetical protein
LLAIDQNPETIKIGEYSAIVIAVTINIETSSLFKALLSWQYTNIKTKNVVSEKYGYKNEGILYRPNTAPNDK